jgi:hypothetical protein
MQRYVSDQAPCLARLAVIWGLYGYAMAALWYWAQGTPLTQAFVWWVAIAIGVALLIVGRAI